MVVWLSDYVDALRREITPLGSDLFAQVTDEQLAGHLADAFWEARLDGFLQEWEADEDGIVTPVQTGGQDLPRDLVALIVLYAGIKVLRNRIINLNSAFRAQAGPVEYEVQNSATVLAEMLRQLAATKNRLLEAVAAGEVTTTCLIDGYTVRQLSPGSYGGFLADLYAEVCSGHGPIIPTG